MPRSFDHTQQLELLGCGLGGGEVIARKMRATTFCLRVMGAVAFPLLLVPLDPHVSTFNEKAGFGSGEHV